MAFRHLTGFGWDGERAERVSDAIRAIATGVARRLRPSRKGVSMTPTSRT